MKVSGVQQFANLDPADIREESRGDRDREQRRLKMIKSFMYWAYFKENDRWTQANNEERIIVKRQVGYARCLLGFGAFANATIYFAFFTGIYNFRSTELINMRSVPFLAKFGVSTLIAVAMCRSLWTKQVYEVDLYRVALKYRNQYDEDYKQKLASVERNPELFQ